MDIDSILFDLDGTLWNPTTGIFHTWQKVINRYPGLREPLSQDEITECMGLNTTEIENKLFPSASPQLRSQIMQECNAEEHYFLQQAGKMLYPGVEETLAYLASRYKLAIVSNCEIGYIECFLSINKLEKYFSEYLSFGDTGKAKGENILTVLKRLESKRAIFVGDTSIDGTAANFAGLPFIFARYGFGMNMMKPIYWDYAIDKLPELIPLLEKIN